MLQDDELARLLTFPNVLITAHQAFLTREARQFSDNYVLQTVLFTSVLFFGGIARAFDSRRVRLALAGLAGVLFMATVAGLLTMPICCE